MVFVLLRADGEHGVLLGRKWSDVLSNRCIFLPVDHCCGFGVCCHAHPEQCPCLDWDTQALHRLLWRTAQVMLLPFLCSLDASNMFFFRLESCFCCWFTGNVHKCWSDFNWLQKTVNSSRFIGSSQVQIGMLLLVCPLLDISTASERMHCSAY